MAERAQTRFHIHLCVCNFENHLVVKIYRKDEKVSEAKCYFADIEQVWKFGKWLLFQFGGKMYIVRKSELKANSAFFSFMYRNPTKTIERTAVNKWRIASIVLFVASLLSPFIANVMVSAAMSVDKMFEENMWLFFLLTPIPIASIVLGVILKSKGCKYKKNIVVGIIMTALLCIYGSFTFIFAEPYDHSDTPIIRAEQMIGIEIPEHEQINTLDWTDGTQTSARGHILSTSDIYFDAAVAEEFENQLAENDKWLESVPNDLIGLTSPFADMGTFDYSLIYNIDTSECNALPSAGGTYRFMNILYSAQNNYMQIVEYEIDYIK